MIIVKDKESLEKATKILEEILSEPSFSFEDDLDIDKWITWFHKQKTLFKDEKISLSQYFAQITRLNSFLIAKTSLTEADLFKIEKPDRKRIYDLTEKESAAPKVYSDTEIIELAKILFKEITKEKLHNLKKNTRVETLTQEMRNKRFGFILDKDPQVNINHILENDIYSDNWNQMNYLVGELYLDLQKPLEARNHFEKITLEELRAVGLLNLACLEKDFDSFTKYMKKAFPESYLPKTYGRYLLSFMIGNECSHNYEIEVTGQRNLTFTYSTGIIKIQQLDICTSFISDNRLSPDGRTGLWISPGKPEKQFSIEKLSRLDFKQVLGWQDLPL